MVGLIDRLIKPDEFYHDLSQIDFDRYYRDGFRLIMLDIDNTLALHGAQQADEYAQAAVGRIRRAGLACWIVSNGGERRVRSYAGSLGISGVAMANKPSTRGLKKACRISKVSPQKAIMIGDQLLTDIFGAHRAGCLAILVRPRFRKEAWNIRFKRKLEKVFYHRYKIR